MLGYVLNGMTRVSAFTVHEPPGLGGTGVERAEHLLFVRDGFSWRAALFGPFYLLARGEWLALTLYIIAAVAIGALLSALGARQDWVGLAFVLLNVVLGFEMSNIRRWSLGRRGWQEIAAVSGRNQDDAERRFFEAWLPAQASDQIAPERHGSAGPWSPPRDDTTSRIESALRGFSSRLRTRYATKS